jgi:hypothetical protein
LRVLVPILFVLIAVSLLLQLLYFVFVVHFQDVVASVVIIGVVLSIYKLSTRGR